MALTGAFSIIWLDAHIGRENTCNALKELFQTTLAPAAAVFPAEVDPIDALICCIKEYAAPVSFASNVPDALELINSHAFNEQKIIIITSGSLGKELIPAIRAANRPIHSYYIFCAVMLNYRDWLCELLDDGLDIQMFDFERDLLTRLSRDLSDELIKRGEQILGTSPKSALNYFECGYALGDSAVTLGTPTDPADLHRPSTKHRVILGGENGLIAKAKIACNEQNL